MKLPTITVRITIGDGDGAIVREKRHRHLELGPSAGTIVIAFGADLKSALAEYVQAHTDRGATVDAPDPPAPERQPGVGGSLV